MQQVIKVLRDKKSRLFFQFVFFGYSLFMLVVTQLPTDLIQSKEQSWISKISLENGDKVVHATLFFIFTLLLYFAFRKKTIFNFFILPFTVGILIEILQSALGWGRTFDWYDILANGLGIMLASIFIHFASRNQLFRLKF